MKHTDSNELARVFRSAWMQQSKGVYMFTQINTKICVCVSEQTSAGDRPIPENNPPPPHGAVTPRFLSDYYQSSIDFYGTKDSLNCLIRCCSFILFAVLKPSSHSWIWFHSVSLNVTCKSWTSSIHLMFSFHHSSKFFFFFLVLEADCAVNVHESTSASNKYNHSSFVRH